MFREYSGMNYPGIFPTEYSLLYIHEIFPTECSVGYVHEIFSTEYSVVYIHEIFHEYSYVSQHIDTIHYFRDVSIEHQLDVRGF